jgi:hypothetical protein
MNEEYSLNPQQDHSYSLTNIPVTSTMIDHLRATKPWVRFMSTVMFVLAGLMILLGVVMFLLPFGSALSKPGGAGIGSMGASGAIIGFVYILMAGFYIAPAYFLHRFASSISDLLRGGGDVAMEAALGSQKSFWRFSGISTLVVICIYGFFFIIMILFGAAALFR